MLPDALTEQIRESCGEALLLDARRGVGLLDNVDRLYETCQRLRNMGFTRCIDLTAVHLPPVGTRLAASGDSTGGRPSVAANPQAGEEAEERRAETPALPSDVASPVPTEDPSFQLYLLLRHPAHGQAALQLKWKYTQTESSFHPSVSRIWASAGLAERELWELFGIAFSGNDNMFPLLLDPQFDGYPLRRDYELPQRESYGERLLRERYEAGLVAVETRLAASARSVESEAVMAAPGRSLSGSGNGDVADAVNRVPTGDSGGGP